MSDRAIVDGRIVPLDQASVSVLDLGFLRGIGAFETLRTYGGGHPHALPAHLERLRRTAAELGIELPFDEDALRPLLRAAYGETGAGEVRINLVVTPGRHTGGIFGADRPTWVALVRACAPPPERWYREGIAVVTFRGERIHPSLKTTVYITGRRGLEAAARAGAEEALYVDDDGYVHEGVTSNVLAVRDGAVVAPAADVLPGITQDGVRAVAGEHGLGWRRAPLRAEDLYAADEVWITSSVRELVPVVRVDGRTIGDGRPGPRAGAIGPAYHRRCVEEAVADAQAWERRHRPSAP